MWAVKTRVVNRKIMSVEVRAVHSDPVTLELWFYRGIGSISTPDQRQAILQNIKDSYTSHLAEVNSDTDYLSNLENSAEDTLNEWEETLNG